MAEELRRTPLHNAHRTLGARMAPFAGWDMPVQYAGILDEARAVRASVGVFDVSHMGRYRLRGRGATDTLERVSSNGIASLAPGMARYSLLLNQRGGIMDDVIVNRIGPEQYLVVVNAANAAKDWAWLGEYCAAGTALDDHTVETAAVAVQGPQAVGLVARTYGEELAATRRFSVTAQARGSDTWLFCRTGYTGEDGFEIVVPAGDAPGLWEQLLGAGAVPCALGARDVLRTEAGYPLYGHEIDEDTSPVDAGLLFAVSTEGRDFVGRAAVDQRRHESADRVLVGLLVSGRVVPRQGYTLYHHQVPVGTVTSGVFSPLRERGVGMGFVTRGAVKAGDTVDVDVRGNRHSAMVVARRNMLESIRTL